MNATFKVGDFQFCFNAKLSDQAAITMAYRAALQIAFEQQEAFLQALDNGNYSIVR